MCCSLYSEESANVNIACARERGMTYMPLNALLAESEVVFTCLNKNVLLLQKEQFEALGSGKILFNTSIGPGFDSKALEVWLEDEENRYCCDSKPSAGEVSESFFDKKNVFCQNISSGRTKQAFMLLSQKVLANLETALVEM